MSVPEPERELLELRRSVRDLAALAALPVVWSTGDSTRVVESLADALLGMLRLDFVLIRYRNAKGGREVEVARLAGRPSAAVENRTLGELLEPWLADATPTRVLPPLPGARSGLRGFIVRFGLDGASGLIATGSARSHFPSDSEQVLLRVAANQAAVILARQRAEAERGHLLLEVEAERRALSQVFERSPSFMCLLTGPDHVFTRANEHYRRLVGDRDLLGKPLSEALPEVVAQGFVELLDEVFRTGEPYVGRDVLVQLRRSPDEPADTRVVDFTYQAVQGADGSTTGIMVQGIDLTERKRAEAELRAKDARLQLVMNNVKDYAVVVTDAAGTVVEWAAGAERITGFPATEAIGQAVDLLFTEADRAAGQPARERREACETGKAEDARWHRRSGGGQFFANGVTAPLYDEFGDLHGFGKIFRDATAEWQARQRLAGVARASGSLNTVLSVDAITKVLTDEARAIIGAHRAVTSLAMGDDWEQSISTVSASERDAQSGLSEAGSAGKDLFREMARTHRPIRLTREEAVRNPAWPSLGQDAELHAPPRGLLAVPLAGHGGKYLGLLQLSDKFEGDFTEEDEAILQQLAATAAVGIENARLYDSLKEQDRRKDEFLAMLAHELRNPLAPVRTGLEVLRRTGSRDKVSIDTREMMARQIGHMVRLIDDLMDVSRISTGKLALKEEILRLQDVVDTAVEAAKPLLLARNHEFRVTMEEPQLRIRGDLTRLAQVIGNLLNNAAKYTPPGGTIMLSAQRCDGEALIRVQDSGEGIAMETLPHIFELFTQARRTVDRADGGLGIGLALARKLVQMHGGSLEASSPGPRLGSTFTIRLPVAAEVQPPSEPAGALAPDASSEARPLRVVVVDDNVDAAETFALVLGMSGHQTSMAHSGPQALELIASFRPDVVFLDIGLPGMSGYDVARQLRSRPESRALTIVALTGWGSEADRARARQAGFDHHLTKPVELAAASSILDQVAERKP
ncbi:MAG TPA: ATP-binding protein [Ramlibacter sp.]|nr:ATP-binding protein [Ramlibacter sp.]